MILGGVVVPHPPLIIPDVGLGKEKEIQDTIDSYEEIAKRIGELEPDTIILISPHGIGYSDYINIYDGTGSIGDFSNFGAKDTSIKVEYDKEFIDGLCDYLKEINFFAGKTKVDNELDHGCLVPLYFINKYYKNYKVIRISIGGLLNEDYYELGTLIKKYSEQLNRKIFVVASGDLSHTLLEEGPYGFNENGVKYEERIVNDLKNSNFINLLDYNEDFLYSAGICGHKGFCILGGILDGLDYDTNFYSHEGPFGVGYMVCSYIVNSSNGKKYLDGWLDNKKEIVNKIKLQEDGYIQLARKSIEEFVINNKIIDVAEVIHKKSGCFVSIHKFGELRGCIGTTFACYNNLSLEIINNAISACSKDPRFRPIKKEELPYLVIDVDELSTSVLIESRDELDPKKYGVIVEEGLKRGVLLPDLDGVDTVEEQLSIACRKANITSNNYEIYKFEVIRHRVSL